MHVSHFTAHRRCSPGRILPSLGAVLAFTLVLLAAEHSALAQAGPEVAGTYSVEFEEVANSCTQTGMSLRTAKVQLTQKDTKVSVTIPSVPIMDGRVRRAGKFRASARRGKTAIQGVDGRFSVVGRVDQKTKRIQFIFVAEFFQGKKPLCSQSWNAQGK